MNTKDNMGGIRDFILRKVYAAARLRKLEVLKSDAFIMHQVLNFFLH